MNLHCLFFWSFILSFFGCSGQKIPKGFAYDLSNASEKHKLKKELKEISGLAFLSKNKLYCLQDEKGIVYSYDMEKNEIEEKMKFGKDGDFEGIALAGPYLYALRSDGTLYRISNFTKSDKIRVEKIDTFLDESYDTEGLCYDEKNNQLLIACKNSPPKHKGEKHIYRFDMENQNLIEKPHLVIALDEVYQMKETGSIQKNYDKAKGGRKTVFNPSGISVHPLTQEVYILSSEGNTLLVLAPSGKIIHAIHLKKSLFPQPEGIAFDSNGTMYIANEGHGEKATIKTFKYHSN